MEKLSKLLLFSHQGFLQGYINTGAYLCAHVLLQGRSQRLYHVEVPPENGRLSDI